MAMYPQNVVLRIDRYLRDCKHIMYHEDFKPEIQFLQQTGFK